MLRQIGFVCLGCSLPLTTGLSVSSGINHTTSGSAQTRSCSDAELQNYALLISTEPAPGVAAPRAPQCVPSQNQGLWPMGRPSQPAARKPLGLHGTQAKVHPATHQLAVDTGRNQTALEPTSLGTDPYFAHVYVIQSNKDWCVPPCQQASWELAAPKPKNGSNYALFEAAIWHQDKRVALYRFDDKWAEKAHMAYTELCHNWGWACIGYYNHRESRKLLEVGPWPASADKDEKEFSAFLLDAFKQVFAKVDEVVPTAKHIGLTYHGHGARADGALFEGNLVVADTISLLKDVTKKAPLSVLNFGGNCAEGRWNMLEAVYPYANWILASELLVGGIEYKEGEATQESLNAWQKLTDMNVLLGAAEAEESPEDMARRVVEARQTQWHTVWKAPIMRAKLRQSIAAYHGPKFEPFQESLRSTYLAMPDGERNAWQAHVERSQCDVFEAASFMDEHAGASQDAAVGHAKERFEALRAVYASTHDMVSSPTNQVTNGLGFNWVGWNSQPCDLKSALGDVPAPPCGWNDNKWDDCDQWKEDHPPLAK